MYSINDQPTDQPLPEFRPPQSKKWHQKWWVRLILAFLTLFLILIIAWGFYVARLTYLIRTGQLDSDQFFGQNINPNQGLEAKKLPTMATADDPGVGPLDAKVVIVEFSDFQCPACGDAYPVIKQLRRNYKDQVRFVYRDFPLEDLHPQAVLAAMAGQCAHEQGKFWLMHDKIFENQDELDQTALKRYAVQIGLNNLQFDACLQSNKYFAEVENDLREGLEAGVRSTPTFFINGIMVKGALPLSEFQKIIVAALNQ